MFSRFTDVSDLECEKHIGIKLYFVKMTNLLNKLKTMDFSAFLRKKTIKQTFDRNWYSKDAKIYKQDSGQHKVYKYGERVRRTKAYDT